MLIHRAKRKKTLYVMLWEKRNSNKLCCLTHVIPGAGWRWLWARPTAGRRRGREAGAGCRGWGRRGSVDNCLAAAAVISVQHAVTLSGAQPASYTHTHTHIALAGLDVFTEAFPKSSQSLQVACRISVTWKEKAWKCLLKNVFTAFTLIFENTYFCKPALSFCFLLKTILLLFHPV